MFIEYFDENYYGKLARRKDTFRKVFELLNDKKAIIVETGTARTKDNWSGDGQSTVMFNQYIKMNYGTFISIDNSKQNIETAKKNIGPNFLTNFICEDSVKALNKLAQDESFPKIDLLYLDSFDLDVDNFHPSAMHHLKELTAITSKLKKGTIIVVDDNKRDGKRGKGTYVQEYLEHIGATKIFDEYQVGFIL